MAFEPVIIAVSLIIVISILLTVKFRQPLVFWLLILGAVVGPFGLKIIQNSDIIATLSEFGAIFLLFTLGVKFSIQKLLKQGFIPIILTALKLIFISLFMFFFISLLGFNAITSLIISLIVSITSTAIVVKIIEQRGWIESNDVNFIVNILILEDIFAVVLLTFISGFNEISAYFILIQLGKTIALLSLTYLLSIYGIIPFTKWIIKNSNEDVTPFIALVLAVGLSYLTARMGLSASAGAFLAGSVIRFL
ncbi:MAG: cation:proton antiporter, partial [Nanoarchaeota archaeon]